MERAQACETLHITDTTDGLRSEKQVTIRVTCTSYVTCCVTRFAAKIQNMQKNIFSF